jgi:hypothetical protein
MALWPTLEQPKKGIRMNTLKHLRLRRTSLLIAVGLVVGLTACDSPHPAEDAGKKLDDAVINTSEKIEANVDKMGEKLHENRDAASIALNDTEITTKVKSAIFSEPGLKTLRISVDTKQGVVTLTGSVNSQANFERASALAASVQGVTGIVNSLQVNPAY